MTAPHADRDRSEQPQEQASDPGTSRDLGVRYGDAIGSFVAASKAAAKAERTIAELRAEVKRWRDKAQESGAAYANANTKHHAEWDRANRLERLADTLAERAVDLEDRARAAESRAAELEATVAKAWDEGFATGKSRAMRHMSDEPSLSLDAPNPYRAILDAPPADAEPEVTP